MKTASLPKIKTSRKQSFPACLKTQLVLEEYPRLGRPEHQFEYCSITWIKIPCCPGWLRPGEISGS